MARTAQTGVPPLACKARVEIDERRQCVSTPDTGIKISK